MEYLKQAFRFTEVLIVHANIRGLFNQTLFYSLEFKYSYSNNKIFFM